MCGSKLEFNQAELYNETEKVFIDKFYLVSPMQMMSKHIRRKISFRFSIIALEKAAWKLFSRLFTFAFIFLLMDLFVDFLFHYFDEFTCQMLHNVIASFLIYLQGKFCSFQERKFKAESFDLFAESF